MSLLPAAEALKKLQKKCENGGTMSKEEAGHAVAITGQVLFGYDEATRIKQVNVVYQETQKQIFEITQQATKFKMAIKKMTRKAEKDQATQVCLNLIKEAEQLKKVEK